MRRLEGRLLLLAVVAMTAAGAWWFSTGGADAEGAIDRSPVAADSPGSTSVGDEASLRRTSLARTQVEGRVEGLAERRSTEAAALPTATVEVQVVSSVDGRRLAGVVVEIYEERSTALDPSGPRSMRATTNEEGRLSFQVDVSRPFSLWVEPEEDHGLAELDLGPLLPDEVRRVVLEVPTPGDMPWYGLVTLAGEPAVGARVRLLTDDDDGRLLDERETDATGLVRFDGSSWLDLEVRAEVRGQGMCATLLTPDHGTPGEAQELPLWPYASLLCTVMEGEQPVPDVEVRARVESWELRPPGTEGRITRVDVRGRTDGAGRVHLMDLPAEAPVDLEVHSGGQRVFQEDDALVLHAGEQRERTFVLGGAGRIVGRVEGLGGEPQADVRVDLYQNTRVESDSQLHWPATARRAQRSTTTSERGEFHFDSVPHGAWYVGSLGEEGAPREHYILSPRVLLSHTEPRVDVVLRVVSGQTIEGRVVGPDGLGIEGVDVHGWNGTHGSIGRRTTDGAGAFVLGPCPEGTYNVWPIPGEEWVKVAATQAAAGRDDLVFTLERGLTLSGTVVDAETGEPISYAMVFAYAPESDRPYLHQGSDSTREGRFELEGLPPGEIALKVEHEERGLGILRGVHLTAGEEPAEVTLELHPSISVRVRYAGEAGQDVAILALQEGVPVIYVATRPGETTTFTTVPGTLVLRAERPGHEPIEEVLEVSAGDRPDIVLGGE